MADSVSVGSGGRMIGFPPQRLNDAPDHVAMTWQVMAFARIAA
jgi:hypothetical protein